MRHFEFVSRLIRKHGPSVYWIIMIFNALLKFVNEALLYNAEKLRISIELKPGKFVYIQTPEAVGRGRNIIRQVKRRYTPDGVFFHIGKRGGHVAALHAHKSSKFFSRLDISNFFGQVTRGKVVRALRRVGFGERRAFDFAIHSVVVEGDRKVLPFGFCQSPLLATLALERSQLGLAFKTVTETKPVLLSVYMDDIVLSGDDRAQVSSASASLLSAAEIAGFPLSVEKMAVAVESVEVFNCDLAEHEIILRDDRMRKFVEQYGTTTDLGKWAIERYISALSRDELIRFQALL